MKKACLRQRGFQVVNWDRYNDEVSDNEMIYE